MSQVVTDSLRGDLGYSGVQGKQAGAEPASCLDVILNNIAPGSLSYDVGVSRLGHAFDCLRSCLLTSEAGTSGTSEFRIRNLKH
jgi:hypothetical protein